MNSVTHTGWDALLYPQHSGNDKSKGWCVCSIQHELNVRLIIAAAWGKGWILLPTNDSCVSYDFELGFSENTLTNKCHADVLERSWVPCFSTVDPSVAIMLESEKGRAYFYVLNTMLPDSDKGGKAPVTEKDRVEAGHCYSCILGEQSCTLPSRSINTGASFLFWTVVLPTSKIFLAKAFFPPDRHLFCPSFDPLLCASTISPPPPRWHNEEGRTPGGRRCGWQIGCMYIFLK